MNKDPDSHMVRQAQAGSRDAVGLLFERHWLDAWRLARSVTGSSTLADDVAQEALVRAVYRIRNFKADALFRTWLHRIVVNEAISALRRDRRSVAVADMGDLMEGPAHAEDSVSTAIDLMEGLAPDQRAVLVLHHCLDYSLAETAQILELPVGTVQSRAARGLARLRTTLEASDGN